MDDRAQTAVPLPLTPAEREVQAECRAFASARVAPDADAWDAAEHMPRDVITECARRGYLGAAVPIQAGGGGKSYVEIALVHEAIGWGSSSLCSLLTVHSMVASVLARWGTAAQKSTWLPRLATGDALASFAVSEPGAGSDVAGIATRATPREGGGFVLDGQKSWITFGEIADVFLVAAQSERGPVAVLLERGREGFAVTPTRGMLGFRASHTASLAFTRCAVPAEDVVTRPGFGLSHGVSYALDLGRLSVAASCVGLVRACLETAAEYARQRVAFGAPLAQHQLVRALLAEMGTAHETAALACWNAARLRDAGAGARHFERTLIAKYTASRAAARAASDTVQVLGAHGCSPNSAAQRFYRDAKIMEIIEGSHQIQQNLLGQYFAEDAAGRS